MDHSEAGTSDDQTRNDSTQTISSTVQVDPSSDVTDPLSDVNMPPFEAGVDSSTVVKKVTFEDMPLLERQSNETVRYNSPVHPVRKQYVEKDQALHTKDVKDPSVGPGQAGLFNLGNTCFMNSGLQCVFSNSHLVRYFLTQYHLTKSNESTLTGVFTRLLYKVWSSQYSVIHPLDFKQTLGLYHPQFHDYRQHDCQEFLALLLDTLHEQLNSSASGGPRPHPGGFQNFAAASCSSTYEPIYSASCPSPSRQPDSFAESSYTANNKVSSATGLRSQVKRAGGSINIQFNREADSEISSGVACIDGIRNIENPMDMKAFSPSALIQSQTPPNDDSNLSCQSSDSEQSVGLSRLKLKDQNKDRETQVTSSTDLELVARSGVNNSGINLSTISASDSHLQYSAESSKSVHSPGIVDASQNAVQKRSAEAEMTNVDKDPEVSSSQEESLAIIDSVASGDIFSTSPREAMGLPVESIDAQGCVSVLNNAAPRPRLPTLEDLYAKDTKTLNTNVLAVEYMDEDIQMDSDKFAKPDNINRPQEGPENVHMNELALQVESKANKPRQVKDTNIQAENLKKCRVLKNNAQSQSFEGDFDDTLSINNVKRMKFEGTAKNIKRQALHKVNREKFLFHKSDTAVLGSDGDSCSSEEAPDENLVEMADEGQSSVSRDSPVDVPTDPVENLTHENIAAANEAWEDYLEKNRSIIIDTFQGQFRSTVICSECQHVSVTHEPFMYLSIPLPHAMERQISVILVSCDGPPTRYLFTMHKNDSVWKLKKELLAAAGFDTADVILTEVLDCHISRILDDNVMLCYVNDSTREIYGFRMLAAPPLPLVEDSERGTTLDSIDQTPVVKSSSLNTFSGDVFQASSTVTTATYSAAEIPQQDIFSNMGMFNGKMSERDNLADADTTVGTSKSVLIPSFSLDVDLEEPMSTMLETESDTCNDSTPDNGTPTTESQGHQSADLTLEQASTSHCITQDEIQPSLPPRLNTPELDLTGAHSWEDEPVASTSQFSSDFLVGNWSMEMEVNVSPPEPPHPQQWRSCAICLEDMVDTDLMVHPSCGGTLCQSCLDMSFKHYGDVAFTCPVCTTPVNPTSGFLPLSVQSSRSSNSRLLAVPVACRTECEGEGLRLFSHPNVVYLYSRMKGQEVYEMIDRLLPFACTYTISLTDGQGLHCSRCVYTARCNGCLVLREGEITLQPGDHLTVTVTDTCRPEAPAILNHKSMEKLRPKDPITIYDCFTAFTESEILDEHNPWYCPQCAQNQRAKKTMTVWRYPDTLIIHLKRFVFHELSSTKVDNKVVFPLDNLDLSEFLSGPRTKELYYDLHGIVCHFGGANAGHYTAYTKHPLQDRWFYYNDETVSERAPRDDDHSTGYVLFYQRQGTDIKFSPLTELKPPESAEEPCSSTQGESVPLTEQPQPSSMHEGGLECRKSPVDAENLASILQNLKEQKDEATESVEPDSTFDFYI